LHVIIILSFVKSESACLLKRLQFVPTGLETVALQHIDPPAPWIIAVNAGLLFLVFVGLIVAWRNGRNTAAMMAKELKQD
jgi:hypothetical protein